MTGAMWLRNLEAYGIQVALLILAGALLARLFRIEHPRAALLYWRTVLAVCLLLPLRRPGSRERCAGDCHRRGPGR
jgi:hypothetical protein